MRKNELSLFDRHESVEPILFARGIVAETSGGEFNPATGVSADPLVAIAGFADEVAVTAYEILAETVEPLEPASILGSVPAGDEHPLLTFGVEVIAGENGACGVRGRCGH